MPQSYPSVREVAVLQQSMQMVLSSMDAETVLHHILLIARNHFSATISAVYLQDPGSGGLICRAHSAATSPLTTAVAKDTPAGWAAFTRAPVNIPDVEKESHRKVEGAGIRSLLALPLQVRDRIVGVLELKSEKPDAFPADSLSLLSVFSGQAAIAIENAQLHSADLRRVRQIEIINLIARSASAAHDRQQFFSMLADLLSDSFDETMIAVVLSSSEGHITVPASAGASVEMQRFIAARHKGIISEAFATRSLVVVNNVQAQSPWPACFPNSGSELCVPLVSLGEIMGAIVLGHQRANFFSAEDRTIAQAAADVCATAAKNVQLSEELRRIANLDSLTGLYNQRYLHTALAQEISRSRRHHKEFGLLMLEVRGFRRVNSILGWETGDNVLRGLAEVLKSSVRKNDLVSRHQGDRFVVLLPELNADGMLAVLGKLQSTIHNISIPYPDKPMPLAATWAAVQYPADAQNETELVKSLISRLDASKATSAENPA